MGWIQPGPEAYGRKATDISSNKPFAEHAPAHAHCECFSDATANTLLSAATRK